MPVPYKIVVGMFKLRINHPGFGPRIISFFASDLQSQDLSGIPVKFYGAGPPSAATLLPGNGAYLLVDRYEDTNAHALYSCTTAGTNATSVWTQISGGSGGGYMGDWNPANAYTQGQIVRVPNTIVYDGITILAGTYGCNQSVPALSTLPPGYSTTFIPQFPEPAAGRCWTSISFTPQSASGGGAQPGGFANATIPV
jgi:hypothetical protein